MLCYHFHISKCWEVDCYFNVLNAQVVLEYDWYAKESNLLYSFSECLFPLQQKSLVNHLWRAFQHTSSNLRSAYSTVTVSWSITQLVIIIWTSISHCLSKEINCLLCKCPLRRLTEAHLADSSR